jgi:surfeit locus 1 family protein
MRPHERPPRIWPVVIASALGFAILVGLSVWQFQRMQWKEGLLAQLAANAAAGPVDLATAEQLARNGGDIEFVKVRFRATYKHDAWKKMISTYEGGQGWTIITPAVTTDGRAVIVDRGRIPGQILESFSKPEGEVEITGVARTYMHGQAMFDPDNDPAGNLWYWWDVPAMLRESNLPEGLAPVPFVVQLLPGAASDGFPKPPEPRANLSNNHLGYAITWFGLALTLLGVAFVYIRGLRNAPRP